MCRCPRDPVPRTRFEHPINQKLEGEHSLEASARALVPMSGSGLLHVGELTLDDVVVEDHDVDWKQAGGGALYSAVGALVWTDAVAIAAAVGHDYPEDHLEEMAGAGVDVAHVHRVPELPSVGLWLLYEAGGARRQFEKHHGGSMRDLDLRRSSIAAGGSFAGVHLAPQSSEGQRIAVEELRGGGAITTLDIMVEPYIETQPYLDGSALRDVDAFLPSVQEVFELWGHDDLRLLEANLQAVGVDTQLVLKRGAEGVDVLIEGQVVRVPSVTSQLVDPTGAGDAFCGGFLAGLVQTGDPIEAAVCGVASASFVCETRGAFAAARAIHRETAMSRAETARRGKTRIS